VKRFKEIRKDEVKRLKKEIQKDTAKRTRKERNNARRWTMGVGGGI
jgi:hypothetical protein